MLGESGTEQFSIVTWVDGKEIGNQKIHDPFIHSTTVLRQTRWQALKSILLGKLETKVVVAVRGTNACVRSIMTLDPVAMEAEEAQRIELLGQRPCVGTYSKQQSTSSN